MKSILIFTAFVATVSANVAGRSGWGGSPGWSGGSGWSGGNSGGWGNSNSGWGPLANINMTLDAAVAAIGQGSGAANQQLLQIASGTPDSPAVMASFNGVSSTVSQADGFEQIAVANAASGTSSSINDGYVSQIAQAIDEAEAYMQGGNFVNFENSASSEAGGHAEEGISAATYNDVIIPPSGH